MPAHVSESVDPAAAESSQPPQTVKNPTLIMVVDDDPLLRTMLEKMLHDWGYACVGAPDGITALACLSRYPIQLVITDYQMPRLDGLELLKRLRTHHPSLPVIIFSGECAPHLAAEATAMGALAWLFKPLDINGLRKMVRKAVKDGKAARAS